MAFASFKAADFPFDDKSNEVDVNPSAVLYVDVEPLAKASGKEVCRIWFPGAVINVWGTPEEVIERLS